MEPKVLNLPNLSLGIPPNFSNQILRENLITPIKSYFESGKNIIFLHGENDLGKSTFLAQFVRKNADNSFSSFLKPSISPDFIYEYVITDLASQIHWYIKNEELTVEKVTNEIFQRLLVKLFRKKPKDYGAFNIVLDGLDDFENQNSIERLFNDLPVGDINFNFLISCQSERLIEFIPKNYTSQIRSYPLPGLTKGETSDYLSNYPDFKESIDSKNLLDEIWSCCNNGAPGKLKNFVRVKEDLQCTIEDLLDDLGNNHSFYDLDWQMLESRRDFELIKLVLAFIALDNNPYTIEKLSDILEKPIDLLKSAISSTSFLSFRDEGIGFSSIAHKSYFASKLSEFSELVSNKNIELLLKNKESLESLLYLPSYLDRVDGYQDILEILTPEYLPKIITKSQSIGVVIDKLQIGRKAARNLDKESYLSMYSLQTALLENVEGLHVWNSEIEARISLGDYEGATKLAQGAILKEDQLKLFARIAKKRSTKDLPSDEAIKNQIDRLSKEIDFASLNSEKAIDIASDVLYSDPSLAYTIIQKTSNNKGVENVTNWAMTKLSLSTINSPMALDRQFDKIADIINDPRLHKINKALSYLIGNYSTIKFIKELEQNKNDLDRLAYIGLWIGDNKHQNDVEMVIDYALKILVRVSSIEFPKTKLLSELAEALITVENDASVNDLAIRFEDFENDALKLGPTSEFFKFKANLIIALIDLDYLKAARFFNQLIEAAKEQKDVITKGECFAVLYCLLKKTKNKLQKSQKYFIELIPSALKNSINKILSVTADHVASLKEIILLISKVDPNYAYSIASSGNIERRRDMLTYYVIVGHLDNDIINVDLPILFSLIDEISGDNVKEAATRRIFERLKKEESFSASTLKSIKEFNKSMIVDSPGARTNFLVDYLQLLSIDEESGNTELFKETLQEVSEAWESLNDDEISKVEIAYYVADDLQSVSKEMSFRFMEHAEDIRENMWVDSLNSVDLYYGCINLCITIFSGLIKDNRYSSYQIDDLVSLISRVPSVTWKISLFAQISHLALLKDDINLALKILNSHIKPLYQGVSNQSVKNEILPQIAILFYRDNATMALEEVVRLPETLKEEAVTIIIDYLLKKRIPTQSYEDSKNSFNPEFVNVEASVKLLEYIGTDRSIYHHVKTICEILSQVKEYSEIMSIKVARDLTNIIKQKLPDPKNIKHEGFLIISEAQIARLTNHKTDKSYYEKLVKRGESLENVADRIFVLTTLAELIYDLNWRSKQLKFAGEITDKALIQINSLDCNIEVLGRIDDISKILKKTKPSSWKKTIQEALTLSISMDETDDIRYRQKRLIDSAYRLDKNFTNSLIELFDKDESRKKYASNFKKQVAILKTKDAILSAKSDSHFSQSKIKNINLACDMLVAELNSNLVTTKRIEELRGLLDVASSQPLLQSFGLFFYYFSNIAKRSEEGLIDKNQILEILSNVNSVAELIFKLSSSNSKNKKSFDRTVKSTVYKPGSREESMVFIKKWLSENLKGYLKISDPYFKKEDLLILRAVLEIGHDVDVFILTSLEQRKNSNLMIEFAEYWSEISHQDTPKTQICIVGYKEDYKSPFHDRFYITEGAGLRVGTSQNDIGKNKISEISVIDEMESYNIETNSIDVLLNGESYDFKGKRIFRQIFPL